MHKHFPFNKTLIIICRSVKKINRFIPWIFLVFFLLLYFSMKYIDDKIFFCWIEGVLINETIYSKYTVCKKFNESREKYAWIALYTKMLLAIFEKLNIYLKNLLKMASFYRYKHALIICCKKVLIFFLLILSIAIIHLRPIS